MTDTEATGRLVHRKCGGPVDLDPTRGDLRSDMHVQGWQTLGLGVLFLVLGALHPIFLLGVPFALLALLLWLLALVGAVPEHDRRCPPCRATWKADQDRKHARPEDER